MNKKSTLAAILNVEWGFDTTGVSVVQAFSDRIYGKTSAWAPWQPVDDGLPILMTPVDSSNHWP